MTSQIPAWIFVSLDGQRFVRHTLFCAVLAAILPHVSAQTANERKVRIMEKSTSTPSQEAIARKVHSEAILKKEAVPFIEHLPVIEDSTKAKRRTKEEISKRAIAICLTAVKGEGIDQATVDSLVKKFGAERFFTPKEAAFIKDPHPKELDRIQFSWRYEDYWVLLWTLGYIDKLDRPETTCDVRKAVGFLRDRSTEDFIRDAKLRDLSDILDQADLIYRYHWAVVDA